MTAERTATPTLTPAAARILDAAPTTSAASFGPTVRRLGALLRPRRRLLGVVVALGVVSIALNAAGPWLLGRATDLVFAGAVGRQTPEGTSKAEVVSRLRAEGRGNEAALLDSVGFTPGHGVDFPALARVLAVALAVYVVSGLCWLVQGRVTASVIQQTIGDLRSRLARKLSRLPLSYVDGQPRGDLLSRLTNDVDNLAQTMQQTISQVTNSLLLVVAVLGVMFWISPVLALVAVVTVPLSVVLTTAIGKRAQPRFAEQWKHTGALTGHVEAAYSGHDLVRAFGRQEEAAREFRRHNEAVRRAGLRAQVLGSAVGPVLAVLGNLGYVLVAVIGGLRVATGALSIGEVQAFIQYARQVNGPLTLAASIATVVQSGVASAERILALLDEPEEVPDRATSALPTPVRGHVVFTDVQFRYVADRPLIHDLSFEVRPGQVAAIVGPTGAGKTTLVNLLMRFYEVSAGRITLDGVDVTAVPREQLRRQFGMVLQDTWLFEGTIAENIAYGRADADRSAVTRAARQAHVDHLIRTLPRGYDTRIGDDASGVSAGERQLITIARAFLSDPAVLILDEATSSVDARTELLVQQAITRLSRGRTTFVIAHRLSTIRSADLILFLRDGTIVERGSHDELLAAGGAYAAMYAAQFAAVDAGRST